MLHKSSKDAIRMFQQEAALLQRLHHEQIPDLRAYFEEEERFFIVMDLVAGKDLCGVSCTCADACVLEGRPPAERLILCLVCSGLCCSSSSSAILG